MSKGRAHVHGRKWTSANENEKGKKEEKTHQVAVVSHNKGNEARETRQGDT